MIKITNLQDLKKYFRVPDEALAFIEKATAETANGHYEFGPDCHINVMNANTAAELAPMEAHEIFVDAQCMICGEEKILYADKAKLPLATPYNAAKDVAFYDFETAGEVTYKTGECVVLFPAEAHLPCRAVKEPTTVKKAVIKLRYPTLYKG